VASEYEPMDGYTCVTTLVRRLVVVVVSSGQTAVL